MMYTEIRIGFNCEGDVIDLRKVSAMKLIWAIISFANIFACVSCCGAASVHPIDMPEGVIKEYDAGLQLAEDLCKFVGVSEMNMATEGKTKQLKNSVVYWDCDDVLQKNTDPSLIGSKIWSLLKDEGADACKTTIWKSPKAIVEESILELTQKLKKCDIPQFVVTQCTSDIQTQLMRERILETLGYSFEDNILENDETCRKKCNQIKINCQLSLKPGQTTITLPRFSKGIAYAGSAPKEIMFEWLFDLIQSSGKFCDIADVTFVFTDDKLANLKEFCTVCQKRGIKKYRAYHYTNVLKQAKSEDPTDKTITNLQKRSIRNGKFLSYKNACFLAKIFPSTKLDLSL